MNQLMKIAERMPRKITLSHLEKRIPNFSRVDTGKSTSNRFGVRGLSESIARIKDRHSNLPFGERRWERTMKPPSAVARAAKTRGALSHIFNTPMPKS